MNIRVHTCTGTKYAQGICSREEKGQQGWNERKGRENCERKSDVEIVFRRCTKGRRGWLVTGRLKYLSSQLFIRWTRIEQLDLRTNISSTNEPYRSIGKKVLRADSCREIKEQKTVRSCRRRGEADKGWWLGYERRKWQEKRVVHGQT